MQFISSKGYNCEGRSIEKLVNLWINFLRFLFCFSFFDCRILPFEVAWLWRRHFPGDARYVHILIIWSRFGKGGSGLVFEFWKLICVCLCVFLTVCLANSKSSIHSFIHSLTHLFIHLLILQCFMYNFFCTHSFFYTNYCYKLMHKCI